MAHVRTQLRDAVIAALQTAGVAGGRVTKPRGYDYNDVGLPAVAVSTSGEEAGRETMGGSMGGGVISRNIELAVLLVASGGIDMVDVLDTLAVQVEVAIASDATVGSIAHERFPTGMEIDFGEAGETRRAMMRLTFSCLVLTEEGAPETAL